MQDDVFFHSFSFNASDKGVCFMKRVKEKSRRIVKYWRIRYQQASEKERMFVGLYVLAMLAYAWWAMLVF
jgi:hypothetical protein